MFLSTLYHRTLFKGILPIGKLCVIITFLSYYLSGSSDELINLTENAGIIDTTTGCHLVGSEREGRIPVICKRNFLRCYRKVCLLAGAGVRFVHGKSYFEHKNMSTNFKRRKNEFFKQLDFASLGRFPLMDRNVDDFYLQGDDQRENPAAI